MGVWLSVSIAIVSLFLGLLQCPMKEHTGVPRSGHFREASASLIFFPSDTYTLYHMEFLKQNVKGSMLLLTTSL